MHFYGYASPRLSCVDFTERWIADDNWTYTADLSLWRNESVRNPSVKTLLVFYGIDTIANIVRWRTQCIAYYTDFATRLLQVTWLRGSTTNSGNMYTMSQTC